MQKKKQSEKQLFRGDGGPPDLYSSEEFVKFAALKLREIQNNVSYEDAPDLLDQGEHEPVLRIVEAAAMYLAPEFVVAGNGDYCGSGLMRTRAVRSNVEEHYFNMLEIQIGIEQEFAPAYEIELDTSYLDNFMDLALQPLEFQDVDLVKRCVDRQLKPPIVFRASEADSVQSAYDHAVKGIDSVLKDLEEQSKSTGIVVLDPTPGTISRLKPYAAMMSDEYKASYDIQQTLDRLKKESRTKVLEFKTEVGASYYCGFYPSQWYPRLSFGFEINPYSKALKISGRVNHVTTVDDGYFLSYYRKEKKIKHRFKFKNSYMRFQTRYTVPFFSARNLKFGNRINDMYLFYAKDPFAFKPMFNFTPSECADVFPIGLVRRNSYDNERVFEFDYFGMKRKAKFFFLGEKCADIDLPLIISDRQNLIERLGRKLEFEISTEKSMDLEHPTTGHIYLNDSPGFDLAWLGECFPRNSLGKVEPVISKVEYVEIDDKNYKLTEDMALLCDNGIFYAYEIKETSEDHDTYTLTPNFIPGVPSIFREKKIWSVVSTVCSTYKPTEDIVSWHKNTLNYRSRNLVFRTGDLDLDVAFKKKFDDINHIEFVEADTSMMKCKSLEEKLSKFKGGKNPK